MSTQGSSFAQSTSLSIREDSYGSYRYVGGLGRVYVRCKDARRDPASDCRDTVRAASAGTSRSSHFLHMKKKTNRNKFNLCFVGSSPSEVRPSEADQTV